jgi:hypothetical protein
MVRHAVSCLGRQSSRMQCGTDKVVNLMNYIAIS